MTVNEIKKALYKEKPIAVFTYADKSGLHYETRIEDEFGIFFCVPLNDLGDAQFAEEMPSQLLIRYLL